MNVIRISSTLLLLAASSSAFAGTKDTGDPDEDRPVNIRSMPSVEIQERPIMGPTLDMIGAHQSGYLPIVMKASKALDMEPAYADGIRNGLELIYKRDYKAARAHFSALDQQFPGTGISSSINALLWQALMIENFDFKYNKQYEVSHTQAISELKQAVKAEKHLGWTHFLMAGLTGVEAIHYVRQSKYMAALSGAFTAVEHAEASRKAAPDFVDLALADGMYNYWRTIITNSSSMLPDFGDHRALGIQQLQTVEREGFFLRPAATLALTFSWMQERDKKKAIAACEKNRKMYPDNVINNLLSGQTYISARQFTKAVAVLDHLHTVAPENNRAHYYKGLAKMRLGKKQEAIKDFNTYLKSDHLEDYQLGMTHFRLGQAFYSLKQYSDAEKHYVLSVKANGFKGAKSNLSRLRKAKKEGRIQY